MPSDQELHDSVEEWKKKGNDAFMKNDVDGAIHAYSQGLVQVDRITSTPLLLKAALLSNRAAGYLKATKLQECQDDCASSLAILDKENDTKLRSKILYRRAKSLFLQANMPHKKKDDDLQDAAKDLLSLLSFDPKNKEATQLLNTIRAQHAVESKNNPSTPLSKALEASKKKDDKMIHHIKIILGMLNNDSIGASMEFGRLGGVQKLLDYANDEALEMKARYLSLQCLSCAGSHPPFCRQFMKEGIQKTLSGIVVAASSKDDYEDLVVGALTVYLRLILHLDRDDPDKEIEGSTYLEYDSLVKALVAAFMSKRITLIRAAIDLLSSWTAGVERDAVIRASLDNFVDLPIPKTKQDMAQMNPKEHSTYRNRMYKKKTRDQAWAFERAFLFIEKGGMEKLASCTIACDDAILRREMTVSMGKVFAALEADEKMKDALRSLLDIKDAESEKDEKKEENLGVVIEEITDEDEEVGKIVDVDEDAKPKAVTFDDMMTRTVYSTALLLAQGEVGAWSLGSNVWPQCKTHLNTLADSTQKTALCLVAELLAAAASVKETRPMVGVYLGEPAIKGLVKHTDKDVRTAAASSVAKLGLAEQETEDIEIIGLLEAACYMLEDGELDKDKNELVKDNVPDLSTGIMSSIDRGVEVMTYLASKTLVKEELASGFKAMQESEHTGLQLLVKVADRPDAGGSLSAFGLASTFQLMAATPLMLRKEAFEGKQVTMEQYDELKGMQKTEQEKELVDEEPELKEDSNEQCAARIVKMANANVPRALCQLSDGATDQTLSEVVLGLNRFANEPAVRGTMIQQGVLSKLIKIEKEEKSPSDLRKKILRNIRHCIGKMLVTTNPNLLTSAQRMGSIKPLIQLVRDVNSTELQQFESLMALTNIGSLGDDTKKKIVAEKGISSFKFAMFSDHEMVKQAATEAMCNLVGDPTFMETLQDENELRLWLALSSDFEEHYECARAAAGCLAMATVDPKVAKTLISLPNFKKRMDETLESGSLEIMHRMLVVIQNLVELGDEFRAAAEEHGLIMFARAYVESYHDGSQAHGLEFGEKDLPTFNATVEVAKQIVRASG